VQIGVSFWAHACLNVLEMDVPGFWAYTSWKIVLLYTGRDTPARSLHAPRPTIERQEVHHG
jgi:hypothetical protein